MARTLILIRHAKSGWDDPFAHDHARTLATRGRRDAPVMAHWLADGGHMPDEVLCSTATRTRQTLDLMAGAMGDAQVQYLDPLYHASAGQMLGVLRTAAGATVAMIGHNPGIGEFACGMVVQRPDHSRYAEYPTCAVAVIRFVIDRWADARPATGTVTAFAVPGDLA